MTNLFRLNNQIKTFMFITINSLKSILLEFNLNTIFFYDIININYASLNDCLGIQNIMYGYNISIQINF
jgi:hypothetical protein